MASNPTRKTEVQAYSFEVRRMNSALVRRDPVMLHDPLRTHTRATVVGVILGMVGLLGFLIFGILKPSPKPPDNGGIVIGKESAQVYVYVDEPEMLIPTFNLASARLILMGRQQQAQQGGQAQGQQEATEVVQPTVVPDDRLNDIPRGRLQGIPGANVELPGPKQRISDNWAVCHNLPLDETLEPGPQLEKAEDLQETAVLAGMSSGQMGKPLAGNEAIYIKTLNGDRYLIYRPATDVNNQRGIVRAQIPDDAEGGAVITEALRLEEQQPRPMSLGLLNSIDKVDSLTPPEPPGRGEPSEIQIEAGQQALIGQVFVANPTADAQYFVMLRNGKQRISAAAAELIRLSYSPNKELDVVSPARLKDIFDAPADERLALDDYPESTPEVVNVQTAPTTCLGWSLQNNKERTTLYVGSSGMPFPKRNGQPVRIRVGKANEQEIAVNFFYMPPGRSAVVHAATSEAGFASGPIQLISDRGLRYGIPNAQVAKGLGLDPIRPAPSRIVELLPTGTSLNLQAAEVTYDSFEPPPGSGDSNGQEVAPAPQQAGG